MFSLKEKTAVFHSLGNQLRAFPLFLFNKIHLLMPLLVLVLNCFLKKKSGEANFMAKFLDILLNLVPVFSKCELSINR